MKLPELIGRTRYSLTIVCIGAATIVGCDSGITTSPAEWRLSQGSYAYHAIDGYHVNIAAANPKGKTYKCLLVWVAKDLVTSQLALDGRTGVFEIDQYQFQIPEGVAGIYVVVPSAKLVHEVVAPEETIRQLIAEYDNGSLRVNEDEAWKVYIDPLVRKSVPIKDEMNGGKS